MEYSNDFYSVHFAFKLPRAARLICKSANNRIEIGARKRQPFSVIGPMAP